jgi:3-methyl-2-oxobutanoate hydroxymethyltransferase
VLVVHDLLGMGASHEAGPKFVKRYANLGETIVEAATAYRRDVEAGTYPDEAHSY